MILNTKTINFMQLFLFAIAGFISADLILGIFILIDNLLNRSHELLISLGLLALYTLSIYIIYFYINRRFNIAYAIIYILSVLLFIIFVNLIQIYNDYKANQLPLKFNFLINSILKNRLVRIDDCAIAQNNMVYFYPKNDKYLTAEVKVVGLVKDYTSVYDSTSNKCIYKVK